MNKLLAPIKSQVIQYLVKKNNRKVLLLLPRVQAVRREPEIGDITCFLEQHPGAMIPYAMMLEYQAKDIEVGEDEATGYPFALREGTRYYFPQGTPPERVRKAVRIGLLEQDARSPHRYQHDPQKPLSGNTGVLVGASDCLVAVSMIPYFQKLVLFEADSRWQKPMALSLGGHPPITECVSRYVGSRDDSQFVKLDTFFEGQYEDVDFIQADIEGSELDLLLGADALLSQNKKMAVSICCYHTPQQETEVRDFLTARGFSVTTSPGYIFLETARALVYPYLRRGIIYGVKEKTNP